ncbi:hypothetical protein [Pleionea sediminis]|uniref:hypothetical protein n=1 Tax=Pleionea sediminis TaxID=2569479 RepID=UPI0011850474|nr:hypothetical protein [Pleionea sediminis]
MSKSKAPKYCYFRKGRWVYIPYSDGKLGKEIPLRREGNLIRKTDPMSWVWVAYEKLIDSPSDSLRYLIDKYLQSETFIALKPRTKDDYLSSARYLKNKELTNGDTFGDVAYESITPGVLTKLMDKMSDTPIAANHRLQFLAAVYSWGYARDICSKNPCQGVKQFSKVTTKEYVSDERFYFALSVAKELKTYLYPMMIIAYCCRARISEISRTQNINNETICSGIRMNDINDEGIFIYRSKGSLPEVTLWSDFLKQGFNAAIEYSNKQDARSKIIYIEKNSFLIHDQFGNPIKKNAFDSAWQRLMKKCKKLKKEFKPFSVHELKAKGIDDHKTQESGHKSESAKAVYLRKTKRTESTK